MTPSNYICGLDMKTTAYLLLGSNLGNRIEQLQIASDKIEVYGLGKVTQKSRIYETEAWGFESSDKFLNQALEVETELAAQELLEGILQIELAMGRERQGGQISSRNIDIDILLFGDEKINEEGLTVPHPRMNFRKFVLLPLSEIAGGVKHPTARKSITSILANCKDKLEVSAFYIKDDEKQLG